MSKHNLSIKKIKKQILSANDLIESNFNKLKYFKSNFKKILFNKDNRLILAGGAVVILTLSYFLIPTFYSKQVIQTQIKNQVLKNYNIDLKFNEKINYGLLPRPHFSAKNLYILREDKIIGTTNNLKVYLDISKFIVELDCFKTTEEVNSSLVLAYRAKISSLRSSYYRSVAQLDVLLALVGQGEMTLSELTKCLGKSHAIVSRACTTLVKKGKLIRLENGAYSLPPSEDS